MNDQHTKDPREIIRNIKYHLFEKTLSSTGKTSDIASAEHKVPRQQYPPPPFEDPMARLYHRFNMQWLQFQDHVSEKEHRQRMEALRTQIKDHLTNVNELDSFQHFFDKSELAQLRGVRGFVKRLFYRLLVRLLKPVLVYQELFQSHLIRLQNSLVEIVDSLDYQQRFYHDEFLKMGKRYATLIETSQQTRNFLKRDWEIQYSATREYIAAIIDDVLTDLANLRTDMLQTQRSWEKRNRERFSVFHTSLITYKRLLEDIKDACGSDREIVPTLSQRIENSIPHQIDALFEDEFRGSSEDISKRQQDYLSYFHKGEKIIDIGCGRGEFLELLKQSGIEALGVETNEELLAVCHRKNLNVIKADGIDFLAEQTDDSIGGIFCAQVIEHLPPHRLIEFLGLSFRKLKPGCHVIIETVNPVSIFALTRNFYRDPSHQNPIHPESLSFFARTIGFQKVETLYLNPVPESERLQNIELENIDSPLQQKLNDNICRLNEFLFGFQDFVLIASKQE